MGKADVSYEAVLERIRALRSFDFREYKRGTLRRRIERRMADRKCKTPAEYLALLQRSPDEIDELIRAMLIKVTSFFRDPEIWHELEHKLIPDIVAARDPGEELRIWCAGCATGEEAYSLAILFAEALGPGYAEQSLRVFATDADPGAVASGRRGIYSEEAMKGVPEKLRDKYFIACPEGWCVHKDIRRAIVFGVNNLVSDAPISRLHLIVCRNVFIYFDASVQRRVLGRFHYGLRPRGLLVLGKAELLPLAAKLFEPLQLARRIYRKDLRGPTGPVAEERLLGLLEQENVSRQMSEAGNELARLGAYYRDVVESDPLPAIVTRLDGTITIWNRSAAELWARPPQEVLGKKLNSLGLGGLGGELLVEKALRIHSGLTERESADAVVPARGELPAAHVRMELSMVRNFAGEAVALLYVAQDITKLRQLEADLRKANDELQSSNEELQTTNEELQSSNEELETTNEELQSSNEELQTTNEELQSTNEELETTNEELQSSNAELDTTNRELASRTEEMHLLSVYQRAIVRSLSAAVVVLDLNGRVTAWNLAAERTFGVTEAEALGQLLWSMHLPGLTRPLMARMRKALAEKRALRVEAVPYTVAGSAEGVGRIAIIPLLDGDTRLGAAVIFEDTTGASASAVRVKELGQEVRRLERRPRRAQ